MSIRDLIVAVSQEGPDGRRMGYFPVLLFGSIVEAGSGICRVGKRVKIDGELWMRSYQSRQGKRIEEYKIVAHEIQGAGMKANQLNGDSSGKN